MDRNPFTVLLGCLLNAMLLLLFIYAATYVVASALINAGVIGG